MQYSRRILAVLLFLALGLGTPVLMAQAGEMAPRAIGAAAEQPEPTDCTTCGGDDMIMPDSACYAVCAGVQATTLPSGTILEVSDTTFDRRPEQQFKGFTSSPDPFPPKLTILA